MGKIKITDEELRLIISSLGVRRENLKKTLYDQPTNVPAQEAYESIHKLWKKLRVARQDAS